MDPSEVTRLVAELKLTMASERKVVKVPLASDHPSIRRLENMVVGRIFDSRVVNRDTLRTHLPRILQLRREAVIEIVGDNLFAVGFSSEADQRRALYEGPWHFFRSLMVFKRPVGMQHPSEIVFDEFVTWAQIHNLPINYMVPEVVRNIGEAIGQVLEIEVNDGGNCVGQFARVRICRPIAEPLVRCVTVETENGEEERLALIRYEKLPDFYTVCGRVDHVARHCRVEMADRTGRPFGSWLRAGRVMEARRRRPSSGQSHGRRGFHSGRRADCEREVDSSWAADSTAVEAVARADETDMVAGYGGVGFEAATVEGIRWWMESCPLWRKVGNKEGEGGWKGNDGGDKEAKTNVGGLKGEVDVEVGRELACVEKEGVGVGGSNSGGMMRRWKWRARESGLRGGEDVPGCINGRKREPGAGAEERPGAKLPRRGSMGETLCMAESVKVTAAAAEQPRRSQ